MKIKILQFLLVLVCTIAKAQQPAEPKPGYIPNVIPVPPSAFQFLKFDEMPVSEYTGLPNIGIPIYTITEGNVSFPISMSYHAGGIRVAEEATWIGLGWSLDVGSITQIVNDRDDLAGSGTSTRILPDYYYTGSPFDFPPKYALNPLSTPSTSFNPSQGISASQPYHSFVKYSDYYVPMNQTYGRSPQLFNAAGWTNGDFVDSEPDVFKATFNNHSIQFIIDWSTGSYTVVNKKNYKIVQSINALGKPSWIITTPDGVQYSFQQIDETNNSSGCTMTRGLLNCNTQPGLASRIWHLTNIVTPTNKVINFYWSASMAVKDLPAASQNLKFITPDGQNYVTCGTGDTPFTSIGIGNYGNIVTPNDTILSSSYNQSAAYTKSYLDSISFSMGSIQFKKSSNRSDIVGDVRLDTINIKNKSVTVKKFAFGYDYFYGLTSGRSFDKSFSNAYAGKLGSEKSQRLKLNSFGEVGIPNYQFVYDPTPLPGKASYGTDYWGFYNGATLNKSFIPNPIHIGQSALGDNGNDHNANLNFALAGTLTGIIYPTGGRTDFTYELNSFTNNFYNTISSGNGIRVKTVKITSESGVAKQTNYFYEGGTIMNQPNFYSYYGIVASPFSTATAVHQSAQNTYYFTIRDVSGNSFYASSLFGSGNYVGYSKVTRQCKLPIFRTTLN
jgi:hypothetical protein